ncbi:hypothetical protein HWV62_44419 [Athelia sp. TMB]|nr:hypothetical protein HWV62_44419 [Athelia sp. TMB]
MPYVYNKIDAISLEQMDKIAREDNTVVISCEMELNLDYLIERMWAELNLVKVYTKKRGAHPDLTDPVCMRKGATIEVTSLSECQSPGGIIDLSYQDVCNGIHRSLAANFRYGLGKSSKFAPHAQKVSLHHAVQDEDVVSNFVCLFCNDKTPEDAGGRLQ